MPVITLTLSWCSCKSTVGGWHVEICGRNESIDMSSYNFWRNESGVFKKEDVGVFWSSRKTVVTGSNVWLLTPEQEPVFAAKGGASRDRPPMAQVTQYLEALEDQGYKVVASHSMSFGDSPAVVSVWTLNKS